KIKIPVGPDLRVGQFARVTLENTDEMTLVVPESAVITKGQMDLVFVVEENIARLRLIRTGAVYDGDVEILSGLDPGEFVVVRGADRLQDGQPLTIEKL
ncbi:MAG: efflux RND transporter periplasmic adaptor subunit, partial [Proteobacteria bacterium]|nr:efflux RND transporter periplasmic adaptor subunit [Pseudomonadota bacterium]